MCCGYVTEGEQTVNWAEHLKSTECLSYFVTVSLYSGPCCISIDNMPVMDLWLRGRYENQAVNLKYKMCVAVPGLSVLI